MAPAPTAKGPQAAQAPNDLGGSRNARRRSWRHTRRRPRGPGCAQLSRDGAARPTAHGGGQDRHRAAEGARRLLDHAHVRSHGREDRFGRGRNRERVFGGARAEHDRSWDDEPLGLPERESRVTDEQGERRADHLRCRSNRAHDGVHRTHGQPPLRHRFHADPASHGSWLQRVGDGSDVDLHVDTERRRGNDHATTTRAPITTTTASCTMIPSR